MSKMLKKVLSVSLCAALLTGTAAIGSFSVSAANGPMPPFEKVEVFDDGEETYHVSGGEIAFNPLSEQGYYKWNYDWFSPVVNYLYTDGEAYNSEEAVSYDGTTYGGVKGAYYDVATNTLYLRKVDQPLMGLNITAMGKDFKISVAGECRLAFINLYGYYEKDPECTGLTITGNGVLTLDTSSFRSTFKPISAYICSGNYEPEGDVRVRFDKNVSVNLYGKENDSLVALDGTTCSDPALAIASGNGQVFNITTEFVTYEEMLDKSGVYITEGGTYVYDYEATCASDPDGVYSVYTNAYMSDRPENQDIFYIVRKYRFIDRFNAYVQDNSFDMPEMTEAEFKKRDYTIHTFKTNKLINFNSPDEPTANWHYVGHLLESTDDTDSEYTYLSTSYAYGKTEAEKRRQYRVYSFDYNAADDSYTRSDEPVFSLNDESFEEGGFTMVMEEGSLYDAQEIQIPVPDEPNSHYVYQRIINPDDLDGIYGIETGFFKPYNPDQRICIKRVTYNSQYKRYIEDENFVEFIPACELEKSPYQYVYYDEPIGMQAYEYIYCNDVYIDPDGGRYLYYHDWDDTDYVFTYSKDDIIYMGGSSPCYALTRVDVPAESLEQSIIVRDDLFNYAITGSELIYGRGVAGFANTSYVSTYDAVVGEEVTLHGASVGGKGDKTYALMYRKSGDTTWTKIGTKYGPEDSGSFVPEEEGTYEIMINVKDSTGKVVSATFTVDAVQALTNISTVNTDYIKAGEEVQITGAAKGGTAPYKYEYFYKKSKNAEWTKIKDSNISDGTATFKPSSAVPYDVKVIASDLMGRTDEAVFKLSTSQELKNLSSVSSENVMLGQKVVLHAEASGGTGGYTYALLYKKSSSKTWNRIGEKYGTAAEGSFKPGKAVPYDVMINVKDSSGAVKSKTFKINVSSALKNNSTISADTVKAGEKVVMKGAASGGSGEYKYSFYYKKSRNTAWTAISEYTAKSAAFKPASATSYDVKVVVKDSAGNTAEKNFTVSVTK